MNRREAIRHVLATTLVAGSLPTLKGCAENSGRPLRFWNGFTGPDGRVMLELIRRRNAEAGGEAWGQAGGQAGGQSAGQSAGQSGGKYGGEYGGEYGRKYGGKFGRESGGETVQMQRIPWFTYYNKLLVAGLAERGPEVFVLHMHAMPRFVNAGVLEPIDDVFGRDFTAERVLPNALAGATFAGRVYGLPLDVHPLGMYYNRDMLASVGVEPSPDRPLSLDAFLEMSRGMTTQGSDGKWGFAYTWLRSNAYAIIRQFGGRLVDGAGSPAAMNTDAVIEGLSFCRSLIDSHAVAPPPVGFDGRIAFRQGRVGAIFEGSYMLPEMTRQDQFELGSAPLPQIGPEPVTWGDSHILCLRRGMTAERRSQALDLVRYLSNHSAAWATAGQVPARVDVLGGPEVAAMPHLRAFSSQLDRVAYFPKVGWVFELLTAFDYAVERVLRGRVDPRVAMAEASADAERARVRYVASQEVRA